MLSVAACSPVVAQETEDQMLVGQRSWRVPRLPVNEGRISYEGKISLPGIPKEELYNRAYYWLKNNLKGGEMAMRVHDKRTGQIAGKGSIQYTKDAQTSKEMEAIQFDYEIWIGEEEYRWTLTDFKGGSNRTSLDYDAMYAEELKKVDNSGQWTHKFRYEMLSSLHSFVTLFLQGLQAELATKR